MEAQEVSIRITAAARWPTRKDPSSSSTASPAAAAASDAAPAPAATSSGCCCVVSFPGGLPSSLRREGEAGVSNGGGEGSLPRLAVVRAGVVGGKKARLRRSGGAGGGDDDGRRMIVGRDSTCLYAGGVVDPDRSGLCVGVFDRETKRLHLFPAASSSLRQSVAGYPNVSALARESASSALPAASSASAEGAATQVSTRTLLEDFGSAKKQRAYRSQEANRVSSESVLGSTLEEFLQSSGNRSGNNDANLLSDGDGNAEEAGAEDAVERATREWRRAFLPPFDESATDPMRVYMMEAFAGDEAWRYASKQASVLLRNKRSLESAPLGAGSVSAPAGGSSISDPNRYLPSILQVLKHLVLQGDASKKMYQIKCALLCQDLSRLYLQLQKSKFISRPHPEKNFYMGVPVEIATLFLEQFSTQIHDVGSRPGSVMTKPNLDKCRMHLLLLLLAAYGGTDVPVAGIAQDLHLDAKDAMYLLRLAGCAAGKKREGERRVSLPVPVTFPDAGRRKRGRGGGAGR